MPFSTLNKLAFLGNLAFLVSWAMRYFPVLQGSIAESTILVLGLVFSVLLNLVWIAVVVYRAAVEKKWPEKNLITVLNVMVILVQVYLLASGLTHLTKL